MSTGNKIAILTAISGHRDRLSIPTVIHNNADYYAFVDEPTDEVIGPWKQMKIHPFTNDEKFSNRRKAKPYKIMPELFVSGYDYYFWADATHDVVENPQTIVDNYLKDNCIAIFRHNQRNCAYDEANEILKLNYDHLNNVTGQMKEYQKFEFPYNFGLFELPVIVRRNCFETTTLNLMWWEQICKFSSRDQISFPFCLWRTNIKYIVLPGFSNGINPKTNNIGYNDLIPQTRHHSG